MTPLACSKCPALWSLKNIWLNLQFCLLMPVFKIFFILNAFHREFLAFCFQLPKAQLFLLRLFVGFKFKFCCEIGSWKLNIANGLLHVLMVETNRIPSYLAYTAFFSDHKPGLLWSLGYRTLAALIIEHWKHWLSNPDIVGYRTLTTFVIKHWQHWLSNTDYIDCRTLTSLVIKHWQHGL